MGLESATYSYRIPSEAIGELRSLILALGGRSRQPDESNDVQDFVLADKDYWIDLRILRSPAIPEQASLFVRVALCNPVKVESMLVHLVQELMKRVPGVLVDSWSGERWNSAGELDELLTKYRLRKEEFKRYFGDFQAAVSGDGVFEALAKSNPPAELE